MSGTLTPAALTALALAAGSGLLVAPLLPSLRELRRRRDARPLDVPGDSRVDTRWFAQRFAAFVREQLTSPLEACRATGAAGEGQLDTGEWYLVLPAGDPFVPRESELRARRCNRLIASPGSLRLPTRMLHEREVYAGGALHVGDTVELRAAYAADGIHLGARATVQRWVHAGECLHVATGCVLRGRASAGVALLASGPFTFQRLRAESIELGPRDYTEGWRENAGPLREIDVRTLPGFRALTANRALIEGDVSLPEGSLLGCDLVAWGDVRLGRNCYARGSVKAHGSVLLGDGCRVDGSVVAQRDVRLGVGCRVQGPVLAEGALQVERRCEIGDQLRLATVRARLIELRMGSVVHGVVWALESGRTVA